MGSLKGVRLSRDNGKWNGRFLYSDMRDLLKDRWFWLICAVALALRIWHVLHAQVSPTFWAPAVDPLWYHKAGERIANGFYGPWPQFRAPLYPILLGWVYRFISNDLLWARILNIVLQTGTLVLLYHVAKSYFGSLAARIAGILFAVNGMLIFFSAEILSTSLEVLMALLAGWSTLALRKSLSYRQAVICGIVWGLACITRPNFLLVAIPAILFALWSLKRPLAVNLRLVAIIGLAIPILPVTIANAVLGGEAVLIATQGGVNFWIGNNPQADGISSILPGADRFWTMEQAKALAETEAKRDLAPGALSDFYYAKGKHFLRENPGRAVQLMVRKAALFFNRFEVSNNKQISYYAAQTPGLTWLILLNFAVLLPLAALGFWAIAKGEARLLWALVLAYAASVIMFFVASRFRMPVVPWLCLLAGAGVAAWPGLAKSLKQISIAVAGILLLLAISNPYGAQEAPIGAARYMDGNAYLALDKLDSARACFTSALEDPGTRANALLNLGVTEQRAKRLTDAKRAYTILLREHPNSLPGLNNLGVVAEALKDTNGALDAYTRAFTLDSTFTDARENLAHLLLALGKHQLRWQNPWAAREHLIRSAAIFPSAQSYYHLALSCAAIGETDIATTYLSQALNFNPDYRPAINLMRMIREAPTGEPIRVPMPE